MFSAANEREEDPNKNSTQVHNYTFNLTPAHPFSFLKKPLYF